MGFPRLGLELEEVPAGYVVTGIDPMGPVARYNKESPGDELKAGDTILAVDDCVGKKMLNAMQSPVKAHVVTVRTPRITEFHTVSTPTWYLDLAIAPAVRGLLESK